ncbi:MAG: HDIG domain-containing metalloprotein [Anaerolinea sp.]
MAPQDIEAPYSLSYVSEVLTEQARQEAEQKTLPVYLPSDASITRRQIEKLRITFQYINAIRQDPYASLEQKIEDLQKAKDLNLTQEEINIILTLDQSNWELIQSEALRVLEQVMRDTIREDQLQEAIKRTPSLISFSLSPEEAQLVLKLIRPFITPNSLYSPEQTELARKSAREAVQPITKQYVAGETIVRRGQIITPLTYEALQQYKLIRSNNRNRELISLVSLILVLTCLTGLFFYRKTIPISGSLRFSFIIALFFLVFLFSARALVPNRAVVPYLFPIPAFGLTIASLFGMELGVILSISLGILTAFGTTNSLDLTVYYLLSSITGIFVLGKAQRLSHFIWAGISIGATGSAIIFAYRLISPYTDLIGIATLVGGAFFNGIASASLTVLFQYIFSQTLGLTTALQLLDLSRPDHPLLRLIMQNAPGSYQHSLQVAVLAEQAAEKIGADAMLVRVGGMYHDAGKALNPSFFIENQTGTALDTHDDIPPEESARIIIQHVLDGVELAKKYRIPSRIQDFIREHHGTMLTRYQYARALEKANGDSTKVDQEKFRYPGPPPASRETALLMLADGTQARVRAELPETEEEIRAVVKKVIDYCLKEGQLDNTRLTLRDLTLIADSFVQTLKNTYHPRIRYPEIQQTPLKEKQSSADLSKEKI